MTRFLLLLIFISCRDYKSEWKSPFAQLIPTIDSLVNIDVVNNYYDDYLIYKIYNKKLYELYIFKISGEYIFLDEKFVIGFSDERNKSSFYSIKFIKKHIKVGGKQIFTQISTCRKADSCYNLIADSDVLLIRHKEKVLEFIEPCYGPCPCEIFCHLNKKFLKETDN